MSHPLHLPREVALFFTYESWFQRRRGWRMKPEIKAIIPMASDSKFRARSLSIGFHEGDPSDIQQFLHRYLLRINSAPTAWFQDLPIPALQGGIWRLRLIPEFQIDQGVIEITFSGEPFTPLKSRLAWALQISGAKIYQTEVSA